MRKIVTSVLAGVGLALACGTSVHAQEKSLTIFWAEWDPANYLQELGNEYE
ncbi:MAG: carbohydrate ABC transporter substrate-binding protein, partial [Mesorhizobium sp.]